VEKVCGDWFGSSEAAKFYCFVFHVVVLVVPVFAAAKTGGVGRRDRSVLRRTE
jgi:hypothetical protein